MGAQDRDICSSGVRRMKNHVRQKGDRWELWEEGQRGREFRKSEKSIMTLLQDGLKLLGRAKS